MSAVAQRLGWADTRPTPVRVEKGDDRSRNSLYRHATYALAARLGRGVANGD